jgi:hypothetical protein
MTPDQLRQHAHREPFQPFRVRLQDGRSYDIRHPNLGLVGKSIFIIGIPAPDDPDPVYADRTVWVPLAQIDGIEPLPEPAVPGVP